MSTGSKRPLLLLPIDLGILCAAFLTAFRIRLGYWDIMNYQNGLLPALVISVGVYLIALTGSGIYRFRAREMHLQTFLRVSAALLIAWAVSLTLIYLVDPGHVPPRSVTGVQWMLSLIGVLGLRAVLRYAAEFRQYPQPRRPDPPVFTLADIIDRPPVEIDRPALRDYLSGRTVLVTGAGGSVGSALSRLLIGLDPFRLVLVDVSEYNLFQLEKELRKHPYTGELHFRIADVREEDIMHSVFSSLRPDIIFHAAAYKHVPLMERHPIEAFRNNTMATIGLLRLCEQFDTEQFVFISTDKSVRPASVLGATKRLAEWYVHAAHSPMKRKIIRFGNVFGSQGSVVPLFEEQIRAGGPVTVTHPDMERFFISADEACALVLQTLLFDGDASAYMLRMDPPVRIRDLAERMIGVLGPAYGPTPAIVYTGVRPGEKMNEHLMNEEETALPTTHPAIVALQGQAPFSRPELDEFLLFLQRLSRKNRPEALRRALFTHDLRTATFNLDD